MEEQKPTKIKFSKLPEPLIIHILSMLEMKDAVKTCILSKMWKNLWTQVYNIVFNCSPDKIYKENMSYEQLMDLRKINDNRWIPFVDHTLMQCTGNVKTFHLAGLFDVSLDLLDKWIAYVLDKKVETLKLHIHCNVPDCLFQSSSISKLELCHLNVSTSSTVCWSSLKSLFLEGVIMDDAFFEKIVIGCPVLESIDIRDVTCIRHLNVMSQSVKILKLRNFENGGDVLNIKAPWLRELKISGLFPYTQCELVDVSSVLKVALFPRTYVPTVVGDVESNDWVTEYNSRWIPMVTKLLKALSHVGDLIIGSEPIQVLSLSKLSGTPSPLFMCKHLSIKTYIWKFDLPGIACLLENAPHLETLLIKVAADCQDAYGCPLPQMEKLFEDGDPHLSMPSGKFLHLKNVKIDFWRHSCCDTTEYICGECFDFELVEFILRSAIVLDKLVLCSSRSRCCFDRCPVSNCSFQYLPRLSLRLLTSFLNENEAAEWNLKKSKYKYEFTFSNYASLHPISSSSSSPPPPFPTLS